MTEAPFIPGQRWVSDTEPDLGLGIILRCEPRRATLLFPASTVKRVYAIGNTPLTRVRFTPGDRVENQDGLTLRVRSAQEEAGLITYRCETEEESEVLLPEGQLSSFLQFSRPQQRLFSGQLDKPHWFHLRFETLRRQQRLESARILGLGGGRTALLPHQLYIAHEVGRRSAPRVLLADEVGLGKTIEACLILHHQLLTGRTSRALIMVPSPLLNQWLVELLRRFNLRFSLFDEERCSAVEASAPGENPFHTEQLVLCSPDLFTRQQRRQQVLAADWDLLIVDEAHHLEWNEQQASPEYQLVESLARQVPGVLLLTATPEQLGRSGHFARLRLLDPDRFHSLTAFEEEEQLFEPIANAAARLLTDNPLPEASIHNLLDILGEEEAVTLLQRANDSGAGTLERRDAREQLVSLLLDRHGTGRVLFRNTRNRIQGFPERELHPLPLVLPDEYQAALAEPEIPARQRLTPEAIARGAAGKAWWQFDPRVQWLTRLLKRLGETKVLLICARAGTALDLEQALRTREGIHAALFHEGMTLIERDRAAAWFADPEEGCQILICSEIGSEGRNFQFAHHLVLFDLPLDPDLLEQRIGRLDRIGQSETVRIHVPYFEQSAQAVMLQWYHQGLNAFNRTCPSGHSIFSRLQPALLQMLEEPNSDPEALSALIDSSHRLYQEIGEALQKGRNHLLELNSCREPEAGELKRSVQMFQQEGDLPVYLEQLISAYGVESEVHSSGSLILRPGAQMLTDSFPGLPADGMTVTFDRDIALSREEQHFLTWEHPLVRDGMALLSDGRQGSSSACAIRHPKVKSGSLLLELLLVIECPAPKRLQVGRFLPPTLIRLLLDQQLRERGQELGRLALEAARIPLGRSAGRKIIDSVRAPIETMLEKGEALAEQQTPGVIAAAREAMSTDYAGEIERLEALQRVNPNVRNEEIETLRRQASALGGYLESARLRLDAVQLIVAL